VKVIKTDILIGFFFTNPLSLSLVSLSKKKKKQIQLNLLVQFPVWLPGKWTKVKVIKTDTLIGFFFTNSLSLSPKKKKKDRYTQF
jgi:preprotein translocase subunit SecG